MGKITNTKKQVELVLRKVITVAFLTIHTHHRHLLHH